MKKTRVAVTSIALMIMTVPFVAQAAHVKGAGAVSCDKRLDKSGRLNEADYQFAYGFLTAQAYQEGVKSYFNERFRDAQFESLKAALDNFCRRNPLAPVVDGAKDLYRQLGGTVTFGRDPDLEK